MLLVQCHYYRFHGLKVYRVEIRNRFLDTKYMTIDPQVFKMLQLEVVDIYIIPGDLVGENESLVT